MRQRGADSYWYSSQPTVRVLRALVNGADLGNSEQPFEARIEVNGVTVSRLSVPGGTRLAGPVLADLTPYMKPDLSNQVRIVAPDGHGLVQTQLAVSWYEPWTGNVSSPELAIHADYSTLGPEPNGLVRCDVIAERPSFEGFGMMIAKVGLPPASEVDRTFLAELKGRGVIDQFEVQPDRVTFYLWPKAGQMKFAFFFRPRLKMEARTAATQIFDCYNPDIRAIQAPQTFRVR